MNIGESFYCSRCMREVEDDTVKCTCGYDPSEKRPANVLEEGALLQNGRYQIGAVIGTGGFGITYAAWDFALNHPVAIKEYFPRDLCERDAEEDDSVIINPGHERMYQAGIVRFIHEAQILGTLQNIKNIVPILDWFEANNTAYIVMKYIHGITLKEYVKANSIQPQKLIAMMREIVDALVLVHKKMIIHRDISPTNIMVQEDGTMILIDFGTALMEEQLAPDKARTMIFNRKYAPVEQYDEHGVQGTFTDVYALSATLYHLICGEPPKESIARRPGETLKSPRDRHIKLKKYQDKAIMDGLILQPEKRTSDMEIFRSMLYNLPMKEEVLRRKRFMFRVISAAAVFSAAVVLTAFNFTTGFPLGGGMRYSLRGDGFHVIGLVSDREKISVPESIAGLDVVQVDEAAFQGSEKLAEAVIPGSVRTVGRFAFNNCSNLGKVTLGEGVRRIAAQAFTNCARLQAVITPSSLTEIDREAFSSSDGRLVLLGSLDNPAASIADELGLNYASIETRDNENGGVTVVRYDTRQNRASIPDMLDGKPVTALESGTNAAVFPQGIPGVQSVRLPAGLERIGDYAFLETSISSIDLPGGLKYIGRRAFSQSFIENITLPDSVESVDNEAFYVCMQLRSAKLSEGMSEVPEGCFNGCGRLSSVTLPNSIRAIKASAFRDCPSLAVLTIPDGVRLIESFAFMDCISLEHMYLPPSLGRMVISALDGCPRTITIVGYAGSYAESFCSRYGFNFFNLRGLDEKIVVSPRGNMWIDEGIAESADISLPSYSEYSMAWPARQLYRAHALKSKNVILPEYMEELSAGSFAGNLYVESVDCPPTLNRIGGAAFENCTNLRAINLPEGLEYIGIQAFHDCTSLTDIELPSSVKFIGASAFDGCASLSAVNIPASATLLPRRAFAGTSIVSADVPGNITKCYSAFEDCKSLRSVVFADGVRTLWGTFAGCSGLESVVIPSSATQISRSAFIGCTNLRDVWIYSDSVELDYISDQTKRNTHLFADSPNLTIHCRRGSSAHIYAETHGISIDIIPDDEGRNKERNVVPFEASERIYTDERLLEMLTPKPGSSKGYYWGQFTYALGYGMNDIAYQCLDAYEAIGDSDDAVWASSARRFLQQREEHGYSAGQAIAFFEGRKEHPTLRAGDIVVEINGQTFRTEEEFNKLDKPSEIGYKVFTVLRADASGMLRKTSAVVRKGNPLFAGMAVIPRTFEEE